MGLMAVVYFDGRASHQMAAVVWVQITVSFFVFLLSAPSQAARLYTEDDPVTILTTDTLKQNVHNSSTAWLVQFYSSWCGHCIQYSPTWKALAGDVKDWEQAIRIGVLDCAHEKNFDICKEFEIHFYPTFRYFKAHGSNTDVGKTYRGPDRELQTVRQLMVNFLQNHTKQDWPSHCPPLEPYSSEDILALLGHKSEQYTAVIVEDADSYVGREVILDLMPYQGVGVRRVLSSDKLLMDRLGVTDVPAAYLLHPNGTHGLMDAQKRLRFFFSSFLKLLPGVHRQNSAFLQNSAHSSSNGHKPTEEWREFEKSKVYMADLESGLHYLLRVELATHHTLEGEELKAFKDFATVVAKLFPGRPSVVKLLETLLEWAVSLPLDTIPYDAVLDLVNNKMRISGLFLSDRVQWVGCQGSSVALRGYPCSLWTLFHVLTVQAAKRPDALANTALEDDPQAVLQTMRRYITTFFGCQECGRHFEEMAQESMGAIKTMDEAVLWLWRKHNQVNRRLAGSMSEDPLFPKTQWPTPDLCPTCHEERSGIHVWNEPTVLDFLKRHYGSANISPKYALQPAPPAPPKDPPAAPPDAPDAGADSNIPAPEAPAQPGPAQPPLDVLPRPESLGNHSESQLQVQPWRELQRAQRQVQGVGAQREPRVGPSVSFLALGFSSVDMSLCVLLYAASCVFLMFMFFFFRARSRRWKVRANRPFV
ncbi:sulfhydryl oxidase 2 [Alosa pseudoharengus]|uniref:sulfhydryl oxidase 2 n=1 Tax=Alosa pseudoharengus TaxID=34774 RepID=UPI003F8AD4B0